MATPDKSPGNQPNKPKYSLTAYLVLLFVAAIVLVLLSYFIEQRSDSQIISQFSQQHSDSVSQLEERVTALEERVDALEALLDQYENEIKE